MNEKNKKQDEKKPIDPVVAATGVTDVEVETETSKKNVLFWANFDLANTIYSMVIVSLLINRYILVIGQVEAGLTYGEASLIYGLVSGLMQAGVAIAVPILGALSDRAGKRKPFVITLTGFVLLFASLIGFTHNLATVLLFYVIANVAYQFSLVFYDAMLPFIASREDIGKVSGFGVAWGYLGTIIALLVTLPLMLSFGDVVSDPTNPAGIPLQYGYSGEWITFVLPMLLFLGLGLPILFVREKQRKGKIQKITKLLKSSIGQLRKTFKDIRQHRSMFLFMIGYFFVADIANVLVIYMMPLVTDGLIIGQGGDASDIFGILFIIISTIAAVAFTYFIGKFGDKFGPKNTFYLVGGLWATSLTIGVILIFGLPYINIGLNAPFIFSIIMGVVAGPALGGTWTAQRIMVTELAPKEKIGEYFGFAKLSGKVSSSIGPIIFSSIVALHDIPAIGKTSYGWALISVGIIMAIGLLIISRVDLAETKKNY